MQTKRPLLQACRRLTGHAAVRVPEKGLFPPRVPNARGASERDGGAGQRHRLKPAQPFGCPHLLFDRAEDTGMSSAPRGALSIMAATSWEFAINLKSLPSFRKKNVFPPVTVAEIKEDKS